MTFWFGFPGNLRKLYDPTGGALATRIIDTSIFNGSVGARVERALNGTRQYELKYGALGRDNYEYLNAFHQGHMGPGPFCLLDTARCNLLTVNQSAGSSSTNDSRDFTVVGTGQTLTSDATQVTPFPRTVKWLFGTSAPATAQLFLDKPSSLWSGIPIIPAETYTFFVTVLGGGGAIDVNLRMEWLDASGASLSTPAGVTVTTSTTAWKRIYMSSSPPAGAVYLGRPAVIASSGTIASGESIYLTSFQLQRGTPDWIWHPGTGVYPVQSMGLAEQYAFAEHGMLVSPSWTLQEVV